jgi:putative acetyltransferase
MPGSVIIREELTGDADAVRRVHQQAFPTDVESRLVDLLRDAGHLSLSMVALVDDEVVGHVAFSPVSVDSTSVGWGLGPVAVLPEHQRRGVGSQLVRHSLTACRELKVTLVVVLGEPSFYSRFGFNSASTLGLHDSYGGGDAFQALLLAAERPCRTGVVRYAPEFDLFS